MRTVTVAYLVPVYATVDLDARPGPDGQYPDGAVVKVFEAVESITRTDAFDSERVRSAYLGDPIACSYDDDAINPDDMTPNERTLALAIAESAMWPQWET